MSYYLLKPLFPLGKVCATPGVIALGLLLIDYVRRHQCGDFGDLDEHDKQANEVSVKHGSRILSAYQTPKGKIWIITEADRSITTLLLPDEY